MPWCPACRMNCFTYGDRTRCCDRKAVLPSTPEAATVYTLAAWLNQQGDEALESCDAAMLEPGFQPTSTHEILEAGYRHYHREYVG